MSLPVRVHVHTHISRTFIHVSQYRGHIHTHILSLLDIPLPIEKAHKHWSFSPSSFWRETSEFMCLLEHSPVFPPHGGRLLTERDCQGGKYTLILQRGHLHTYIAKGAHTHLYSTYTLILLTERDCKLCSLENSWKQKLFSTKSVCCCVLHS